LDTPTANCWTVVVNGKVKYYKAPASSGAIDDQVAAAWLQNK
jgi:hypothetical protein